NLEVSFLLLLQQNGVNVTFQMVHGDERLVQRKGQRFGVADTNQQRSRQPPPLRHGNGVDRLITLVRFPERLSHHPDQRPQTMARRGSREASSGTTPPYGWCVAIWDDTTFESSRSPPATTAAAVSSHEVSMPRM